MQQSDAGDFRAHICITPQSDLKIHAARGSAQLEERRMGKKCCRHSRRAVVFTAGGRCSCPGATLSWKHHRYGSVDDKCNMPRGFESKARIPPCPSSLDCHGCRDESVISLSPSFLQLPGPTPPSRKPTCGADRWHVLPAVPTPRRWSQLSQGFGIGPTSSDLLPC